ncbi:orf13 [Trichoplusia ni single nucleopolyhedrovirus]|uniref:Orf13 n=1 Tax=Trichoplusia ni single nucleopolyhedrovirus TaxID=332054 RepID=Q462F3_9ABAC|nr:orf13 [Trichoplusia ni single nucleopolyhedrovirus]AAZ67383.1 orf13 [Trichoplusia ni single nucleopolyhedrovirus]
MKRFKCQSTPKVRTVTEIINSDDKLQKEYDLTEFDVKNLNSLESYDTLKIKLVIVKYMAMLNTLQLTQPLLTIFRDRNATREIVTVVLASLGFVHNRVNPLVNNFNRKMEFIIVESKNLTIPGEPILFRHNENEDIVCIIDRVSIVKMLEKQFDTDMNVSNIIQEHQKLKLIKSFTSVKKRKSFDDQDNSFYIKLNEIEATQYTTLLFIMEHAYGHYYILKNYGIYNYTQSLLDHTIFTQKYKPSLNVNFANLLLSKFKFTVEESEGNRSKSCSGNSNLFSSSSKNQLEILSYGDK